MIFRRHSLTPEAMAGSALFITDRRGLSAWAMLSYRIRIMSGALNLVVSKAAIAYIILLSWTRREHKQWTRPTRLSHQA
jgi:hypothetical protein